MPFSATLESSSAPRRQLLSGSSARAHACAACSTRCLAAATLPWLAPCERRIDGVLASLRAVSRLLSSEAAFCGGGGGGGGE